MFAGAGPLPSRPYQLWLGSWPHNFYWFWFFNFHVCCDLYRRRNSNFVKKCLSVRQFTWGNSPSNTCTGTGKWNKFSVFNYFLFLQNLTKSTSRDFFCPKWISKRFCSLHLASAYFCLFLLCSSLWIGRKVPQTLLVVNPFIHFLV